MCFAVSPLRTAARSSSIPPCTIFAKAAPRPARSCAHKTWPGCFVGNRRSPSSKGYNPPMFIVIGMLPGRRLLVVGDARVRLGMVHGLVVGNGREETIGVGEDVVQVVELDPRFLLL